MKGIMIISYILVTVIFMGCETDPAGITTLPLNDTIEIANFDTKYNYENQISIRMDSVLNDSRCPSNVNCVWEGNAEVRFIFTVEDLPNGFVLNTLGGVNFKADTIIGGYQIKLVRLSPYPEEPGLIPQDEYFAEICVTEEY